MPTDYEPGRLTDRAEAERWTRHVLADDHDLRVHSDLAGWVQLALRCAPWCCEGQSDPGPSWCWLERRGTEVDIVGHRSAYCGGCGLEAGNWVTSSPFALTGDEDHDAGRLRKLFDDLFLQRRDRADTA